MELHALVGSSGSTVPVEATIVVLLVIAALVSAVTRLLRLPYSITLVLAGLAVGLSGLLDNLGLSADLVFFVFLPAILFEAALNTPARRLLAYWPPVLTLAVPGVLVAFGLTAGGVHWLAGQPWGESLLFGALIAATDPVSVVSLFRRLRVDPHLTTVIESESMFNDGTAAVVFAIVLAAVVHPGSIGTFDAVGRFVWMAGGGLALGLAVGYGAARIHSLLDEDLLELLLTTIVAYGSFLLADALGMSGPVACVVAGIVVGNMGGERGMSERVRRVVGDFWEFAAFIVNSLVFLLIGIEMNLGAIGDRLGLVLGAFAIVLVARAVVVYGVGGMSLVLSPRLPGRWQHVLVWGGLRGTVALALVLSVPRDLPHREQLVVLTFGVVLLSLLVQGLTMAPLVRALGMRQAEGPVDGAAGEGSAGSDTPATTSR